jgi:SAM-dependent methyltransferase
MHIEAKMPNRKPSAVHGNRKAHNWLIYDCYDRSLLKNAEFISGIAYDLGAGDAPYRSWLLTLASDYRSVDWPNSHHKNSAIDIAADLNGPLPIGSEVADTVLAFSVLEHLHCPQNALEEACRILRPGGHLLVQTPWQWWIHEQPHDYFRYTPYALRRMVERAGLSVVGIQAEAGFFTTVILKLNYFSLRLIRGPIWLRSIIRFTLSFVWWPTQRLAPLLDKMDRDWELEAPSYFLVAKKPPAGMPLQVRSDG